MFSPGLQDLQPTMGSLKDNISSTIPPSQTNQCPGLSTPHSELQEPTIPVSNATFDHPVGTRKRRWEKSGSPSEITTVNNTTTTATTAATPTPTPLPISTAPTTTDTCDLNTERIIETTTKTPTTVSFPEPPAATSNNANIQDTKSSLKLKSRQEILSSTSRLSPSDDDNTEKHEIDTLADIHPSRKTFVKQTSSPTTPNDKIPKSSIRRTSSSRSALSLVFDISQNQTISRSNSASSRSESRQSKYHTECNPVENPNLRIENRNRIRSAHRTRSSLSSRPSSEISLLGRRESVTNLIYSGHSDIDGQETVIWKRLQLQSGSRSSLLFGRMATQLRETDVTPGEFDVTVDEDYSPSRQSKVTTPVSSHGNSPTRNRSGFLYQVTNFDRLSKDVPSFVRHYAQKTGKMTTETFILRINYLRRRRQLGESSSTINLSSNNSNHNHSNPNISLSGKRSTPTIS